MDLVIVDIETTGLDPEKDEVIELCALRVRWPDFEIVDSMYRRSSPFGEVTPEAAACNGYTPEEHGADPPAAGDPDNHLPRRRNCNGVRPGGEYVDN